MYSTIDFDPPTVCSNCLQLFLLKDEGRSVRRLPLLLSCGHTFCAACLHSLAHIRQHTRAITCPKCKVPTPFSPDCDLEQQLVPNLYILGILTARHLHLRSVPVSRTAYKTGMPEFRHPLPTPPPPEKPGELCEECGARAAEERCVQCVGLYCKICFKLVHASSKSMRKHTSVPASEGLGVLEPCPSHPQEILKHFCKMDKVPICSECSITGDHRGHDVISLASAADGCRQQLRRQLKAARDRLKEMIKTEKSLSKRLPELSNESAARAREVHAAFDQLFALLQCRKLTVLKELAEAADVYEEPVLKVHKALVEGIHSLTEAISATQNVMGDNLLLARNTKKLISELSRFELPQSPQLNKREPIRFNFDSSIKKQLLTVGSVTFSSLKWPHVTITNSTDECQSDSSLERLPSAAPSRPFLTPSLPFPSTSTLSERQSRSLSPQPASRQGRQLLPGKKRGRGRGHSASPTLHSTTVSIEDTAEVLVTHVESPSEFYIHYTEDDKKLQEVMEGVAQCCQVPRPVTRRSIKPGLMCAALYEDEEYYRAQVESIDLLDTTTFVSVFYIDYGNSEHVTLGRLSLLSERITAQPPFCRKCSLANIEPPRRSQHLAPLDWSHRATTQMKSLLKAHSPSPARLKVYHEEPHLLQVDLLLPSATSLLSIREKLVSMGLATWMRKGSGRRAELRIPPPATFATGEEIDVVVSTACSPSNFYIQTVSSADTLSELRAVLDREFDQDIPASIENPQKGMFCCALYSEDAKWYRAEVIGISSEGIDVKYVDYGNHECVTLSALAAISRPLLATPMQALHCKLSDVEPLADSRHWPGRVCDHFNAFFDDIPVLRMKVCGQGFPLPVVLKDKRRGQSLSSMLVVQGLANLHRATPTHSHHGSQISESSSQQRDTPSPDVRAPQEEPPPTATVEDWELPALQLPVEGETVTCIVVQVTSPEDFHVSFASKAATEALSQIMPTNLVPRSWKPGEYGLAHFYGDSSWHRVKVEEVTAIAARVLYLDYGNQDSISLTSIATMPPSGQTVPPLAMRCSLVGVGPVGGAREWPHRAALCFSEQTLDKTLALTVKAPLPSSSSYLPVSLTLASGDDVANLLVASDYAEVVSHSRGRPEATEGTSDLSAGMEQPSPPVGYLSPSPLTPGEEVVISVTFISGGGVIHANLLQEGMLLPALTEEVQRKCHSLPKMTSVSSITPGQPCCALFRDDHMWYRATIEAVDRTTNNATVLYVDFGNTNTVHSSDLVDVAVGMDVPVQAVAMKLANTEAVEWTDEQVQALWDVLITESGDDFTAVIQPLCSSEGYPFVQLRSATGEDVLQRLQKMGVIPAGMDAMENIPATKGAISESTLSDVDITESTPADANAEGSAADSVPASVNSDGNDIPASADTGADKISLLADEVTNQSSAAPLLIAPETVPLPKSPEVEKSMTPLSAGHVEEEGSTQTVPQRAGSPHTADLPNVSTPAGGSVSEEDDEEDLGLD